MGLKAEDFKKAHELIKEYLPYTPLIFNEWLSKKYGAKIYLKLENLQPVGSFKLRGALNKIAKLTEEERARGVIAASAGNHAQGVAWAASKFGIEATIVMPINSPITKILNTEKLGAKVILQGTNVDESFEFLDKYNQEKNHVYIHPFSDDDVILGQGSIAYELSEQLENFDFLFGSIGGGGLLAGVGSALKNLGVNCSIIGSQAQGACSMIRSLNQGSIIESKEVNTFADGIKVKKPHQKMMELLDEILSDAVIVNDEQISQSVLDLIEQARVITEGAGAINLAALDILFHQNPRRFKGKNIVIMICGGNIDINLVDRIIEQGLISSSRRLKVKVFLEDVPGALNLLTKTILDSNANVLQVEHKRDDPRVKLNQSIVEVILETRGHEHGQKVMQALEKNFEIL